MTDIATTTAAPAAPAPAPPALPPTPFDNAWRLANRVAATEFAPKALRGKPEAVLACILTGEELGLGPMHSLQSIYIVEGRPSLSAELMRALVYAAGHRLDIVENTNDHATLFGKRRDSGSTARVVWSVVDAQRAKLLPAKPEAAWTRYPRSMLLARATSELCRMLFSDVIGGLYTPEESASIEGKDYTPPASELHEGTFVAPPAPAADDIVDAELDEDPEDAADRRWVDEATGEIHDEPRETPGA